MQPTQETGKLKRGTPRGQGVAPTSKTSSAAIAQLQMTQNKSQNLPPQQHRKMIKLVGKKCRVRCTLNGKVTEALWDTGAEVSIIPMTWIQAHLPDISIKPVADLLNSPLALQLANGIEIPYEGYAEISFQLGTSEEEHNNILVPMLITNESINSPIIGFNVIEELTQRRKHNPGDVESTIEDSFITINPNNIRPLINLLNTTTEEIAAVTSGKNRVVIPKKKPYILKCRVFTGERKAMVAVFQPDVAHQLPDGIYGIKTP